MNIIFYSQVITYREFNENIVGIGVTAGDEPNIIVHGRVVMVYQVMIMSYL